MYYLICLGELIEEKNKEEIDNEKVAKLPREWRRYMDYIAKAEDDRVFSEMKAREVHYGQI